MPIFVAASDAHKIEAIQRKMSKSSDTLINTFEEDVPTLCLQDGQKTVVITPEGANVKIRTQANGVLKLYFIYDGQRQSMNLRVPSLYASSQVATVDMFTWLRERLFNDQMAVA